MPLPEALVQPEFDKLHDLLTLAGTINTAIVRSKLTELMQEQGHQTLEQISLMDAAFLVDSLTRDKMEEEANV